MIKVHTSTGDMPLESFAAALLPWLKDVMNTKTERRSLVTGEKIDKSAVLNLL